MERRPEFRSHLGIVGKPSRKRPMSTSRPLRLTSGRVGPCLRLGSLLGGRNQAAQAVASSRSSSASMVEMHVCRWKAVLSEMRECRGRMVCPAGGEMRRAN
jgi:hypothetical protein